MTILLKIIDFIAQNHRSQSGTRSKTTNESKKGTKPPTSPKRVQNHQRVRKHRNAKSALNHVLGKGKCQKCTFWQNWCFLTKWVYDLNGFMTTTGLWPPLSPVLTPLHPGLTLGPVLTPLHPGLTLGPVLTPLRPVLTPLWLKNHHWGQFWLHCG